MIHQEYTVGPSAELDVRIQSGRVEVSEGSPGSVVVDVDTSDPGFVVEQRGDLIFVSSDRNSSWLSRNSAYVRVQVPSGTDANIGTASADIEVHAHMGKVDVKTASGAIEIDTAEDVAIKTASGDADVRHVKGDIKASSASGDLKIGEYGGKATFSAASGDVWIDSALGSITVSTASGDMKINNFAGRKATVKTMSGTATIGVPAGTKLELDATLLSGSLNLPKPSKDTPPSEREMTITAKLVSGDLNIRRA